jgi:hypothetical protein
MGYFASRMILRYLPNDLNDILLEQCWGPVSSPHVKYGTLAILVRNGFGYSLEVYGFDSLATTEKELV